MEDDNRLDLSLSLPCGGPSDDVKGKTSTDLEVRVDEADRGSKLIDDFKNFLDGSNHKEESTVGFQGSSQSKPDENLFYDLSKGPANLGASSNVNNGGFWGKNDGKSAESVEDRKHEGGGKRKNVFDEMNNHNHKRHDNKDIYVAGLHVKAARTPHVPITTDEGSTAENEDVADSEAEGSTSKVSLHRDDPPKSHTASVGLSEGGNEGHRRFTVSSDKEFKIGHMSHGVPFLGQPANILNMPYSLSVKESNSIPASQSNQVMASGSSNRPVNQQPVIPANLPLMYAYSPNQLPTVEAAATSVVAPKPNERAKGDNTHAKEEGSSMHTEGDMKGTNGINHSKEEAFPAEYPAIRPGIAAQLKFGGSGSSPNLPWVSTTGPGPNGKTISGVTYRYTGTQIRIVCACHGSHMSPEEFVQHASEQQPNLNGGGSSSSSLAAFPNGNPAASAQN
ncbi:ninja-family protein mc410-like [Rutidosis leptorrhynchoides]|uniref:ninja-family protein mc410-like n=1 Tax=Rutidosis leptorrhynchoides TaxID=125765 RepID=UPI003A998AF6